MLVCIVITSFLHNVRAASLMELRNVALDMFVAVLRFFQHLRVPPLLRSLLCTCRPSLHRQFMCFRLLLPDCLGILFSPALWIPASCALTKLFSAVKIVFSFSKVVQSALFILHLALPSELFPICPTPKPKLIKSRKWSLALVLSNPPISISAPQSWWHQVSSNVLSVPDYAA